MADIIVLFGGKGFSDDEKAFSVDGAGQVSAGKGNRIRNKAVKIPRKN
jgi:hypothetical protein